MLASYQFMIPYILLLSKVLIWHDTAVKVIHRLVSFRK